MKSTSISSNQPPTQTEGLPASTLTRTDPNASPQPPADRHFSHFQLIDVLGTGGMGVVWRARDLNLQREVAVKLLLGGAASHPDQVRRFETEAQAIARLEHPHIVPVLEFSLHQGQPFFTMPLITGGKLSDLKDRFRFNPQETATIIEKLARAVAYAHRHKVLHRDLKPSNVLFDAAGEPHIADFGLAKLLDQEGDLTLTGAVIGTPAYMSPEQAGGKRVAVGPACDIWALGVILFELISGTRPFAGTSRDEVTPRILNDDCRVLDVWPTIEKSGIGGIILKCLQKDPADRYETADALADDLAHFLAGRAPVAKLPRRPLSRRQALTLAAGTAAMLGLGAVAGIRAALRPRSVIAKMRRELHETGQLNLLGPDGLPRWHSFIHGDATLTASADAASPRLVILSQERALLELLPANDARILHFEAEFRIEHLLPRQPAVVFLYQSRTRGMTDHGESELYLRYGINDERVADNERRWHRGTREVIVVWTFPNANRTGTDSMLGCASTYRHDAETEHWHYLNVQLGPAGASFASEQEPLCYLSANQMASQLSNLAPSGVQNAAALIGRIQPSHGLGIGVSNAKATFRLLKLTELPT